MAETKASPELAFDAFVESYALKYAKAADCLSQDRDALLAFFDFPAEHWKHLRTTNPLKAPSLPCAIARSDRRVACPTRRALAMVFKLLEARAEKLASSRWPQPVAKTRSRCDIQRRDRGHRQADRPSARNRRRLTGPGRQPKFGDSSLSGASKGLGREVSRCPLVLGYRRRPSVVHING